MSEGAKRIAAEREPRPKAKLTREQAAKKRGIWDSFNGCICPPTDRRDERCTLDVVRCNGRMNKIRARLEKMGLTMTGHWIDPRRDGKEKTS